MQCEGEEFCHLAKKETLLDLQAAVSKKEMGEGQKGAYGVPSYEVDSEGDEDSRGEKAESVGALPLAEVVFVLTAV